MCEQLVRFDDDSLWATELLATDAVLEVLDEVDKRAFLQEHNSVATRSSARKSFEDEYGKEAERQHSARLKNTEQKTPKRKKQQCFRAEFEPDVHISQAEAKVYAPLGSHVWHVKTARAASGGCFLPMKDRTVPFNAGGTTCREALHAILVHMCSQYLTKHGLELEECPFEYQVCCLCTSRVCIRVRSRLETRCQVMESKRRMKLHEVACPSLMLV